MGTVVGYIIALLVVGGLLFLAASYAFGRGEEMAPVLPDGTPVELPDDRLADGDDLRALRLSVALRGYRMDEVDWLLDRLSEQVDIRDREIARLRSVLHVEPMAGSEDEPELLTHPFPPVVDASDADHNGRLRSEDERYADAENGHHPHPRPRPDEDEPWADAETANGRRPRPVPDEIGDGRYRDTGARPSEPVRRVRTDDAPDPE